MKEFINTKEHGQLYMDRIIFESYFPIIFTCVNEEKELFICICCKNNETGIKWLIGKTNNISIIRMLKNEITVRSLLLDNTSDKISVEYLDGKYIFSCNNSDWNQDSICLPKEDSFLDPEEGEFEDDIKYFLNFTTFS